MDGEYACRRRQTNAYRTRLNPKSLLIFMMYLRLIKSFWRRCQGEELVLAVDDRPLSGILQVLNTGCRWRDVPAYGPPTIYNRYKSLVSAQCLAAHLSRRWRPLAPYPTSFQSTAAR